jgi:hypothetical protein
MRLEDIKRVRGFPMEECGKMQPDGCIYVRPRGVSPAASLAVMDANDYIKRGIWPTPPHRLKGFVFG